MTFCHESIGYSPTGAAASADAGVVDRDAQRCESLGCVDRRLPDRGVGDVADERDRGAAGRRDLGDDRIRGVLPHVRDDHRRTVRGESEGDRPADAGSGARDDGGTLRDIVRSHDVPPLAASARGAGSFLRQLSVTHELTYTCRKDSRRWNGSPQAAQP